MEKLDLSSRLNFDSIDLTAPNVVIKEFASQIKQETNGIIIGTVEKYDGPVESYTTTISSPSSSIVGISKMLSSLSPAEKNIDVDIQTDLGKIGDKSFKYEFYLSTPSFEQYKYRVCFLEFGIANYPVKVVLEKSIADSISIKPNSDCIIICNNRAELEELVTRMIFSKRIINIMQELIHINQIYKNQNQTSEIDEQIECENIPNNYETMK